MTRLHAQPGPITAPSPSVFSEPYWEGCALGELRFQRCTVCSQALHTPAAVCSGCGADALVWESSSGRGVIHSFTVVWRPVTPEFEVPYAPAIIELSEGWFLLTCIIDCETEELSIGADVEIAFQTKVNGVSLPYARLVEQSLNSERSSAGETHQ